MSIDNLTSGERFIFDWQYRMAGGFNTALVEAISRADEDNLDRLSLGFPEEVEAYKNFSRVSGWWDNLRKKAAK